MHRAGFGLPPPPIKGGGGIGVIGVGIPVGVPVGGVLVIVSLAHRPVRSSCRCASRWHGLRHGSAAARASHPLMIDAGGMKGMGMYPGMMGGSFRFDYEFSLVFQVTECPTVAWEWVNHSL